MSVAPLLAGAAVAPVVGRIEVVPSAVHRLVQDYWTAALALLGLCLLAYLSNPNPTSFRAHQTSVSFHTHLRRLSSPSRSLSASSRTPAGSASASGTSTSATGTRDGSAASNSAANGKRKVSGPQTSASKHLAAQSSSANRHILSFSNRINLSIRTPTYKFTSYGLFSTVYVPPSRPSGASSTTKRQQQQVKKHPELGALLGLGGELWLGVFGKWYALKLWDNEEQEEEERRGRLERGVRDMNVEDDDKDLDYSTAPSGTASVSGSSTPLHALPVSSLDRSSSLSSLHATDTVPPVSPTSKTPAARLAKRVFRAGQRRSSPTSLTRLKTKAEHAAREAAEAERQAADEAASAEAAVSSKDGSSSLNGSASGAGGAGKALTDPVLVELQAQLEELRTTAAESEKRLQDELEVLRGKKRDEDAFRAELKAKTKTLEEAKRVAEASRVEAEKELNERKGVIKEVQGRVDRLRDEIRALERKGIEVVERKEKKKRERREREKKLREDVLKKRDELKDKEKGLDDVLQKVGEMERKLEVRRALLASRRAELAQLAVTGMRGPVGANPAHAAAAPAGSMYTAPPVPAVPATATLGGVGAVANAFAVPFGQGAYGRRNYPYVHPLSANNSRPTSIRSGHFDPLTGAFQSAPSSPTLAHPVSPPEESHAPYGNDSASGWPSTFTTTSSTGGQTLAHPSSGFLEHRMQHRAASALPSTDDVPSHFLPFDFDSLAGGGSDASPPLRSARAGSGSFNAPGEDHSPGGSSLAGKPRTLALPLQYLDSGLLATSSGTGMESPSLDAGPLSPMTPHQTSLIPSQLFHMLDDDEDDDGLFVIPDSPTLRSANMLGADWKGLGLDVDDLGGGSRRSSGSKDDGAASSPVKDAELANKDSPVVVSPRAETFSLAVGGAANLTPSATSSPIGPPPSSPFSPWDSTATVSAAAPAPTASALEAPAVGSTILHRLSPSQDIADDLPRAGLSLNPDAKAFAFPLAQAHVRTSSVPSPPLGNAVANAVRASRSATSASFPGSSLPSPTTVAPPTSAIGTSAGAVDPPTKSRMDFALAPGAGSAAASARLSPGFDWPKTSSSPKPAPAAAAVVAPIGTAAPGKATPPSPASAAPAAAAAAFNPWNPFDGEDELLGPLRK
ncbi:hypothetical protein JCM10207_004825 [Rhodosporidiobolus poonsookiae]